MSWKGAFALASVFAALFGGAMHAANRTATASTEQYRLRLYHLHTGQRIDVVYRVGDRYLAGAVEELDHSLRDHRTGDVKDYDLKEFDLLHDLMANLGRPDGTIDIVCGGSPDSYSRACQFRSDCPV
jgi:uncharacterized protein YcbK (DUF882 family)